jgi:GNAT superfamily N-acetyltransferase
MDAARGLELQRRGIETWIRATAEVTPGGELVEVGGVLGIIAPACPQRSLANSAVHRGADGLERALPLLAAAYEQAGIAAAAMWTIEPDDEAEAVLEGAGYVFDGEPAAMFMDLVELEGPDPGDLDWDADAAPREVGLVNDLAYGHPEGAGIAAAIGMPPPEFGVRSYRARAGGEVASVLQTVDVGTDCMICWVATLPRHRGARLASRLLQVALAEARERGLETTTLQASMLGRGVYQRLGYSTIAPLRLYERRL